MPKTRPPVHTTIRMPALLLDRIDAQARRVRRSRSDFVRMALESYVELRESTPLTITDSGLQLELPLD